MEPDVIRLADRLRNPGFVAAADPFDTELLVPILADFFDCTIRHR